MNEAAGVLQEHDSDSDSDSDNSDVGMQGVRVRSTILAADAAVAQRYMELLTRLDVTQARARHSASRAEKKSTVPPTVSPSPSLTVSPWPSQEPAFARVLNVYGRTRVFHATSSTPGYASWPTYAFSPTVSVTPSPGSRPYHEGAVNVTLKVYFPEVHLTAFADDSFRAEFQATYKRTVATTMGLPVGNVTILNITSGIRNLTAHTDDNLEAPYAYDAAGSMVQPAQVGRDSDGGVNRTAAGVRVHSVLTVATAARASATIDRLTARGAVQRVFKPMEPSFGRVRLRQVFSDVSMNSPTYYYPCDETTFAPSCYIPSEPYRPPGCDSLTPPG
jgi:hypothetical protein